MLTLDQIAALQGYENANIKALQYWEDVYPANRAQVMLIALSDTFSSEVFFRVRAFSML